jgi:hypothetical protein
LEPLEARATFATRPRTTTFSTRSRTTFTRRTKGKSPPLALGWATKARTGEIWTSTLTALRISRNLAVSGSCTAVAVARALFSGAHALCNSFRHAPQFLLDPVSHVRQALAKFLGAILVAAFFSVLKGGLELVRHFSGSCLNSRFLLIDCRASTFLQLSVCLGCSSVTSFFRAFHTFLAFLPFFCCRALAFTRLVFLSIFSIFVALLAFGQGNQSLLGERARDCGGA